MVYKNPKDLNVIKFPKRLKWGTKELWQSQVPRVSPEAKTDY